MNTSNEKLVSNIGKVIKKLNDVLYPEVKNVRFRYLKTKHSWHLVDPSP
jgi:hypothetical protein